MGEFAAFIERSKAKSVSASVGLRPPDPRPGALPPDPRYRLALCALAMAPPLPNPKYATDRARLYVQRFGRNFQCKVSPYYSPYLRNGRPSLATARLLVIHVCTVYYVS